MRHFATAVACLASSLSWFVASAAYSGEARLRAAAFLPKRVIYATFFYDWVRETNRQCRGQVRISVIGPAAIKSLEQWNALKYGVVDMHFGPTAYMLGAFPGGDVLILAENTPADQRKNGARALLVEKYKKQMNAMYLTHILDGVKFFVWTTKPAKNGRFGGFRLRSAPTYDAFFREKGAQTVRLGGPAVYTALERGTVDGLGWPLWAVVQLGWAKHLKYRYGPGFMSAATPILVNLDRWNRLESSQRQCLNKMALWLEEQWPKWRARVDAKQAAQLKKAGIKFVDLGPEFAKRANEIYWQEMSKGDPEFVKKIRPLLTK